MTPDLCQKARLSRDARFDGRFFTAVKTTGIYCRPICPATPPKESNVCYFTTAHAAASAGFRPCLRCRPDSAPGSPAWRGVNATVDRAVRLIQEGALTRGSLSALAERLGISTRYLRALFARHVGVAPKAYGLYQQCLFAKQLLHQASLSITDVALASGFNSIRRFNDCFFKQLQLTPTEVRRSGQIPSSTLQLKLAYRPPYDWSYVLGFLSKRVVGPMEWCDGARYGRCFQWQACEGIFTVAHDAGKHCLVVDLEVSDMRYLQSVVANIRRVFDLDVDVSSVNRCIESVVGQAITINPGLRLVGSWSLFESGVRAILGQQISVTAATTLTSQLVGQLGVELGRHRLFPTPEAIASSDLAFFKMPGARKQTLIAFANFFLQEPDGDDLSRWLSIKGVGPWTVNYAKLRGLSLPDILLDTDLIVKKQLAKMTSQLVADNKKCMALEQAAPWRSYLTLQLWNQI